MGRRKDIDVSRLRDLGVTDWQRRKLREVMREYEAYDLYSHISRLNNQLLGYGVTKQYLNYDTAASMLEQGVYANIDELLKDYREEKKNIEEGNTSEYTGYLKDWSNTIKEYFGIDVSPEHLDREVDMPSLEYFFDVYKRYEDSGNSYAQQWAEERVIEMLNMTAM